MEFDFQEFCLGLRGLTEQEASEEIFRKRQRLAHERNFGELTVTEKLLNQEWEDQLLRIYQRTNYKSKEMFKLEEMLKRDDFL